jgi:hypothetical protein
MPLQARLVLEDCRGALADLRDGVQGDEWRRRWVAALVLLRAVGHVLRNVDAGSDEKVGAVIQEKWLALNRSKPEPQIFWHFIEEERNLILKEYAIRAGQGVTIHLGGPVVEATYSYPIREGAFGGRDQREVIRTAIEWWDSYLKEIEAKSALQSANCAHDAPAAT